METMKLFYFEGEKGMMIEQTRDGKELLEEETKLLLINQFDE
jgi:hypothetical protein